MQATSRLFIIPLLLSVTHQYTFYNSQYTFQNIDTQKCWHTLQTIRPALLGFVGQIAGHIIGKQCNHEQIGKAFGLCIAALAEWHISKDKDEDPSEKHKRIALFATGTILGYGICQQYAYTNKPKPHCCIELNNSTSPYLPENFTRTRIQPLSKQEELSKQNGALTQQNDDLQKNLDEIEQQLKFHNALWKTKPTKYNFKALGEL